MSVEPKKMKVADLKTALKDAGLAFNGNKPELVLRYEEYLAKAVVAADVTEAVEAEVAVEAVPEHAEAEDATTLDNESSKPKIEAPTDKMDARAKRFGIVKVAPISAPVAPKQPKDAKGPSAEELARIKKRIERFGAVDNSKGGNAFKKSIAAEQAKEMEKKKAERAARFSKVGESVSERQKREARAARFASGGTA